MLGDKKLALPPLLFGNERATLHSSAKLFGDMVDAMSPGVVAYDPMPNAGGAFRSKSAHLALDGLSLINTSVSPTYVDRYKNQELVILLPVSGDPACTVQVGGDKVAWGLHSGGAVLPRTDDRVVGTGGFRNQLMLQLDAQRLQQQAQAMVGPDAPVPDLMIDRLRALSLTHGRTPLMHGILQSVPLLRTYSDQPQLLNTLGINELLLRQVVILLRPDLFLEGHEQTHDRDLSAQRSLVSRLCDFMASHLSEPIRLSELENLSGMSGRTIQTAFKQVHGCSPLFWLREQRLVAARQMLFGKPEMSISQIALACGFPNASLFTASYRKLFGVPPSLNRR